MTGPIAFDCFCVPKVDNMTIFPFQINEAMHAYNRVSKLKPSVLLEKEQGEPHDIINISAEAKKKQIIGQAKTEVLERIRETK
ncbi:MAG: hypothetical protein FD151_689 [bacterium]|nr:MAG: hypothetical protein FD151_689 [bacterium]